tara:strand:- start:3331 stop:4176 length:846 start_codon:yes stop_codon:yes gene_type:complete
MANSPGHSTDSLVFGNAEFQFSEGATTKAEAITRGYLDVGNVVSWTPDVTVNTFEHFGGYRGVIKKDKTIPISSSLSYALVLDEFRVANVAMALGGTDPDSDYQPGSVSRTQTIDFNNANTPRSTTVYFELEDDSSDKYPLYNLQPSEVTVTGTVKPTYTLGTDYELDEKLGRIRFLILPASNEVVDVAISRTAITSSDDYFFNAITPLGTTHRTGFGSLTIFDSDAANNIILHHRDFKCEIFAADISELSTGNQDVTTLGINVSVDASTPGIAYIRGKNL